MTIVPLWSRTTHINRTPQYCVVPNKFLFTGKTDIFNISNKKVALSCWKLTMQWAPFAPTFVDVLARFESPVDLWNWKASGHAFEAVLMTILVKADIIRQGLDHRHLNNQSKILHQLVQFIRGLKFRTFIRQLWMGLPKPWVFCLTFDIWYSCLTSEDFFLKRRVFLMSFEFLFEVSKSKAWKISNKTNQAHKKTMWTN